MLFEFNLYSNVLLVFFILGVTLAISLYVRATLKKAKAEKWLALFMLLCTLFITPWMLGFAGWYDTKFYRDIIFYVTFHHLFFIGPAIYFYVKQLLNPNYKLSNEGVWHFVPGILYLGYALFTWVYDCFIADEIYFYKAGSDREFDNWYQILGFISMVFYFIVSIIHYNKYKKRIVNVVSFADQILFNWLRSFLIAFLVLLIIKGIFQTLPYIFPVEKVNYSETWWQYFLFGVVYVYIGFMGYQNMILPKQMIQTDVFNDVVDKISIENNSFKNTIDEKAVDDNLEEWKTKVAKYMVIDKAYQNEELTLAQMAKDLSTNQNIISKTINQGFGVNFNDFVNKHRIKAVQDSLKNGEHLTQTILAIALEAGFNSKATFNRAFKKHTNFSPVEWIGRLKMKS